MNTNQTTDEEYVAARWKEDSLLSVDDLLSIRYPEHTTSLPGSIGAELSARYGVHVGSMRRYLDPQREQEAQEARKVARNAAREERRKTAKTC